MSHQFTFQRAEQETPRERVIRLCLRSMGVLALTTCIVFWLSLFLQ